MAVLLKNNFSKYFIMEFYCNKEVIHDSRTWWQKLLFWMKFDDAYIKATTIYFTKINNKNALHLKDLEKIKIETSVFIINGQMVRSNHFSMIDGFLLWEPEDLIKTGDLLTIYGGENE
jgi:hypothetical protein